jgi:hypothetical protein
LSAALKNASQIHLSFPRAFATEAHEARGNYAAACMLHSQFVPPRLSFIIIIRVSRYVTALLCGKYLSRALFA